MKFRKTNYARPHDSAPDEPPASERRNFLRYGVGGAAALTAAGASNLLHADPAAADITAHHAQHASGGSDTITPGSIGGIPIDTLVFNVRDHGAVGNGTTDDRSAIQSTINACSSAGGGIVYFPPGTYAGSVAAHPDNSSYLQVFYVPESVKILGAGIGSTVVKLLASQTSGAAIVRNRHINSGGDKEVEISDITFDGNGANQGTAVHHGIVLLRVQLWRFYRVRVQNVRGTSGTETFHFDAQLSSYVTYNDCEAFNIDGSSAATGFSCTGGFEVNYHNCAAIGMTYWQGFTCNSSTSVRYAHCEAHWSGNGFNCEDSDSIWYDHCQAGGKVWNATGASNIYPFTAGDVLGISSRGFILNGSLGFDTSGPVGIHFTSCIAGWCSSDGLLTTNATRPTYVYIRGGAFVNNAGAGIACQSNAEDTLLIQSLPRLLNNVGKGLTTSTYAGFDPPGVAPTPTMPANNTYITNHYPFAVDVLIYGGTYTAVYIDSNINLGQQKYVRLRPQQQIAITYTAAPSWLWEIVP